MMRSPAGTGVLVVPSTPQQRCKDRGPGPYRVPSSYTSVVAEELSGVCFSGVHCASYPGKCAVLSSLTKQRLQMDLGEPTLDGVVIDVAVLKFTVSDVKPLTGELPS
jgi:hypothetical protein